MFSSESVDLEQFCLNGLKILIFLSSLAKRHNRTLKVGNFTV